MGLNQLVSHGSEIIPCSCQLRHFDVLHNFLCSSPLADIELTCQLFRIISHTEASAEGSLKYLIFDASLVCLFCNYNMEEVICI